MKTLLTILLLTLCAATGYGQTIKALSYSTNGVVVYSSTNVLTFTNSWKLSSEILLSNNIFYFGTSAAWALEDNAMFLPISFENGSAAATRTNLSLGATWLTNGNVTNFRSAIGLPLPALTNTSNVTTMRALAGSTNTNEPYSGIIQYADGPDGDIYEMTVSNGIILKIEMQ